ncbi:MAG: hypothetical protein JOZ18_13030, partial [Chloroflexi bacterium]|nr:hypothetical protein [Chloroflexota bacterium]
MADKHDQERYREEDLMARGPVSRGASNKNAPMSSKKQPPASEANANPSDQQQQPDYNKMLQ